MPLDEATRAARSFLKDTIRRRVNFARTDQSRGIPPPPAQTPCPAGSRTVPLPDPRGAAAFSRLSLADAIARRESRREFSARSLTLDEISFLLWAVQGVRRVLSPAVTLRTVPSAGARHALETYVCALRVEGLDTGIWRYRPLDHDLVFVRAVPDLPARVADGCLGQSFAGEAAAVFAWTAVPYRMEWRYGLAAHKVILLDAGHAAQNLYLACEAIGAGTCAIAAYDQEAMDALLGVDGEDEFTIYMAPAGKRP